LAVALLLYIVFSWLPAGDTSDFEARLTYGLTPAVVWLLGYLDPVLTRIYRLTHRRPDGHVHTGVYVREDLLELIERQKSQADNQLSIEELNIAGNALKFGERKVREVAVKRKKVVTVDGAADISPVMLDELFSSQHSRFPVYEGAKDNFIGVLYLSDLTNIGSGKGVKGKVKSHMSSGVVYLHEADSLADALHAFYLTKKQLFIAINKFEEYVGIVTLEDILHALLGDSGEYDFDQHETRSAVAAKHAKKPKHIDDHIDESAQPSDSPTEVIE
jgi:CBS domain containing-hemolysin-like protein